MLLAGIDYSTHAVDVVTIPAEGTGQPVWHHYELDGKDPFDRARSVAQAMPGRSNSLWDDVLAICVEHPGGAHGTGTMLRIQGAILSCLPADTLVHPLPPASWKRLAGLPGNANRSLYVVRSNMLLQDSWNTTHGWKINVEWTHDAHAAHLMARALKVLLEQQDAA